VKAAALRKDTIRSVSVWSPNRNKRNHLAAGEILPPFLHFGWKQYNFFDFLFDFQILSAILWSVNNN